LLSLFPSTKEKIKMVAIREEVLKLDELEMSPFTSRSRARLRNLFKATVFVIIAVRRMKKTTNSNLLSEGGKGTRCTKEIAVSARPLLVPKEFSNEGIQYSLSYSQRVFVTMESSDASVVSTIIFWIIISAIILGVVLFILSTDPRYNVAPDSCLTPTCEDDPALCPGRTICEPISLPFFNTVDEICVIIFTIDYAVRLLTCWTVPPALAGILLENDKKLTATEQIVRYTLKMSSLIDLCAILPYYVEVGMIASGGSQMSSSSSFIRVLRLARLLRILKLGKSNKMIIVIMRTLRVSAPALSLTGFFLGLGTITFASIFYIIEQGTFTVTADQSDGAYYRDNLQGSSKEVTPFKSIPIAIYYTIITQTTVGYGDIYPTSPGGRALACVLAFLGILVLAIPISIMGSNFNKEYESFLEQQQRKLELALESKAMPNVAQSEEQGGEAPLSPSSGGPEYHADYNNSRTSRGANSNFTSLMNEDATARRENERDVEIGGTAVTPALTRQPSDYDGEDEENREPSTIGYVRPDMPATLSLGSSGYKSTEDDENERILNLEQLLSRCQTAVRRRHRYRPSIYHGRGGISNNVATATAPTTPAPQFAVASNTDDGDDDGNESKGAAVNTPSSRLAARSRRRRLPLIAPAEYVYNDEPIRVRIMTARLLCSLTTWPLLYVLV
jgi:hypothetical protein